MTDLMNNLLIYPDNMKKNLDLTNGLIFSQEVLLLLIKKGITREEAYELVQKNAMKVWREKIDFNDLLKTDKDIMKYLSEVEIDSLFDISKIMKNINKVYERLGLK
jgi:adenylosuccinate lyase